MSIEHKVIPPAQFHPPFAWIQATDPCGSAAAGDWWADTTNNLIKQRDPTNTFWTNFSGTGGGGSSPAWVTNSPDTPPASPTTWDDDFTSAATLPGGGSAKWAWDNQGGASVAISSFGKVAQLTAPAIASNSLRSLIQAVPGSTPWEFATKLSFTHPPNADFYLAGLVLIETATSKRSTIFIGHDSVDRMEIMHWSNATTVSASGGQQAFPQKLTYLKIKNDGTNLRYSFSHDGVTYFNYFTELITAAFTTAPNSVGIAVDVNNGSNGVTADFHWFRRTA